MSQVANEATGEKEERRIWSLTPDRDVSVISICVFDTDAQKSAGWYMS
jgi:hypothetical protein